MGRILLVLLVILAIYLLWRAFGPGSRERYGSLRGGAAQAPPAIKGPDDDAEFLWNIEKNRFKERRAREEAERRKREEEKRRKRTDKGPDNGDEPAA
ncbi:hypothetical protein [Corynebacterium timonense]|uniref:Uncharacterized protein n=1 Tax=Corynebacterium timonense TaxID=441500 RepID=A0A1H1T3Q8_9CORY|nr:hypothetical protein [Corynebacterium timonense]SDS54808.1 hypothetical protein SAMN04488539_1891 [Corynebacterium timonense]